jgi:hypothetical protein
MIDLTNKKKKLMSLQSLKTNNRGADIIINTPYQKYKSLMYRSSQ